MAALGIRFDFVVSRELVGASPAIALAKMRDQAAFYVLNYLVLAVIMAILVVTNVTGVNRDILVAIFALSVLENLANAKLPQHQFDGASAHRQYAVLHTLGALGFPGRRPRPLEPAIPHLEYRLLMLGRRRIPQPPRHPLGMAQYAVAKVAKIPINWGWVREGVSRCFFIWLGSMGTSMGFYVDRFVVADKLGLDLAGVATFYSSFTMTLFTLVYSGVLSFAYPRLIALYNKKDHKGFWREARNTAWHVSLFAGVFAIGLGFAIPILGHLLHRPALVNAAPTLWLMLFGMWRRENAETLYFILFARHQDRAIWLGDLLYLIPAFGCNAVFVPMFGFNGIGCSAIVSAVFILCWRGWMS